MLERPIPILDIIAPLLLIRINIITVRLPEAEARQWGHQWQRLPGRLWRRESTKGSPTTSGTRESRCTFVSPDASEDSDWIWTNCPRRDASWVSPTRHATTGIKFPPQLIRNIAREYFWRGASSKHRGCILEKSVSQAENFGCYKTSSTEGR